MREYTYKLPVGEFYLQVNTQLERLYAGLVDLYKHSPNYSDRRLGIVNIAISQNDYSAYPMSPEIKWENDCCLFTGRGCEGQVEVADPIVLKISPNSSLQNVEHFLRVVTAVRIFAEGGLLVHGAGIAKNGQGYLFTGYSGAGKTTVCRLSEGFNVLNDDLVILSPTEKGWQISATPFTNPTQVLPGSGTVRLHQILHLKQARYHELKEVPNGKAVAELLTHTPVISKSSRHLASLIRRCAEIIRIAEVRELNFLPDKGFWKLL